MSGSGASNLGYGNITPLSNINGSFVNATSSNDPANFTSRVIPGTPPGPLPGLAGAKNNIDAANGVLGYGGGYKGGRKVIKGTKHSKYIKRKIKNITKKYRMTRKSLHSRRKRINHKFGSRSMTLSGGKRRSRHTRRHKRRHRINRCRLMGGFAAGFPAPAGVTSYPAGYGQYQNNLPSTPSYAVGGILSGNAQLGLANPPPITRFANDNVDNYNHFNGENYESRGH